MKKTQISAIAKGNGIAVPKGMNPLKLDFR
jgi:hypothetical protein